MFARGHDRICLAIHLFKRKTQTSTTMRKFKSGDTVRINPKSCLQAEILNQTNMLQLSITPECDVSKYLLNLFTVTFICVVMNLK